MVRAVTEVCWTEPQNICSMAVDACQTKNDLGEFEKQTKTRLITQIKINILECIKQSYPQQQCDFFITIDKENNIRLWSREIFGVIKSGQVSMVKKRKIIRAETVNYTPKETHFFMAL